LQVFNVLVVEDDTKLRQLFCTVLQKNGYRSIDAENGQDALAKMDKEYVDLIICDIMMPQMDGYEFTKTLRESGVDIPILMITAKESFHDKKRGFLAGTDDYMVKPVDVNEMVLRVRALLRRAQIVSERHQSVGGTKLDYDSLTLHQNGQAEVLPQKEFYLLYKLMSYPNKIFTRQQLMDEIWGMESDSEARTVDVHINRLRERIKNNEDLEIVTVRGLGYKAVKRSG